MAAQINKKLKLDTEKSCGYLKAFLETPGVIRNVYKISRLIVLKNSHLCLVGSPRMNGREVLQLATLVFPDTELFEPEVKLANNIMEFKDAFKNAILRSISDNKDIVFLYPECRSKAFLLNFSDSKSLHLSTCKVGFEFNLGNEVS